MCVHEFRINLAVWQHVRFNHCWWRMETFSWWGLSLLWLWLMWLSRPLPVLAMYMYVGSLMSPPSTRNYKPFSPLLHAKVSITLLNLIHEWYLHTIIKYNSEVLILRYSVFFSIDVKLMSECFSELNEWDVRIQKVRVVVLLPKCSVSALCNPIEFILSESGGRAMRDFTFETFCFSLWQLGDHWKMQTNTTFQDNSYCSSSDRELLHGLSKGIISDSKLEALVAKQTQNLNHALACEKDTHTHIYYLLNGPKTPTKWEWENNMWFCSCILPLFILAFICVSRYTKTIY